jgi:hypothetical protein
VSAAGAAATVSGAAVAALLLALATWGDGSPEAWIWISLAAGPLGLIGGGVALARGGGRTALIALAGSGLVCAFWLVLLFSLARGA